MSTSGTTDYSLNSQQIITQALRIIRVLPAGVDPDGDDAEDAETALNLLLKTWTTHSHLWIVTAGSAALVADQIEYSVAAARRMISVRRRYTTGAIDTPMTEMSRQEYDDQPNKETSSVPVMWYFNPQRSSRTLYLWPPASAQTVTQYSLKYTYYRVIEDVDALNNDVDLPQEWLECLVWNLADRLMAYHNVGFPDVTARAAALLAQLSGQDQETASVFMQPQMNY